MMTQTDIDAMKTKNAADAAAAEAAVLDIDSSARLSFHHLGPAEWYEVRSGNGKLLGEADASTVFDGDVTAWRNALKSLSNVSAR